MGLLDTLEQQNKEIESIENSLLNKPKENYYNFKYKKQFSVPGFFRKSRKQRAKQISKRERKKKYRKERLYKNRIPHKYSLYIKSIFWTQRRNKYYQKHSRVCSVCGSSKFIVLHHTLYANLGKEKDEHLIPFCRFHHNLFHKTNGTHKDMIEQTNKFIGEQRSLSTPF
jgi:hypothetical protein